MNQLKTSDLTENKGVYKRKKQAKTPASILI